MLITRPESYFHELVTQVLQSQKLKVQPETELYLVQLMSRFILSENLYKRDAAGAPIDEPLAVQVLEAFSETEKIAQQKIFQHVGDVSLYTAGYFQESLTRKLVDLDYYIVMGETAYQHVASTILTNPLKAMYEELAVRFSKLVEVLAEIGEMTTPQKTEKDFLRLYEIWMSTKSERAERVLKKAGIIPNKVIKKGWQ